MKRVIYALSLDGATYRYVGFTTNGMKVRLGRHLELARKGEKPGAVYDWIRKYGCDSIQVTLIEDCGDDSSLSFLHERERFWIDELGTHLSVGGLNMTRGGAGGWEKGQKRSESWREANKKYHDTEKAKIQCLSNGKASWGTPELREAHIKAIHDRNTELGFGKWREGRECAVCTRYFIPKFMSVKTCSSKCRSILISQTHRENKDKEKVLPPTECVICGDAITSKWKAKTCGKGICKHQLRLRNVQNGS